MLLNVRHLAKGPYSLLIGQGERTFVVSVIKVGALAP